MPFRNISIFYVAWQCYAPNTITIRKYVFFRITIMLNRILWFKLSNEEKDLYVLWYINNKRIECLTTSNPHNLNNLIPWKTHCKDNNFFLYKCKFLIIFNFFVLFWWATSQSTTSIVDFFPEKHPEDDGSSYEWCHGGERKRRCGECCCHKAT